MGEPTRIAATLVLLAGVAACGEQSRSPDEQSAYIDLYLEEGLRACAGQLDAYDRFIEDASERWTGTMPSDDFRVSVHAGWEAPCFGDSSCVDRGEVWLVRQLSEYHELVHMIHIVVDGRSATSLNEGSATALGSFLPRVQEPSVLSDLDPTFLTDEIEDFDLYEYAYAGVLTRFLIDRHGIDAFRAYFRAMIPPDAREPEDFEREFEIAFGERLHEDAWPAFISEPRCTYDDSYCDAATPIDLPFVLEDIPCDDPETLGYAPSMYTPTDNPYGPMRIFRLDNAEPRTVRFEFDGVLVYIGRCGDCSEQIPVILAGSGLQLDLELGTYVFIVRQVDEGPRFSVTPVD